ncbi:hypothetical protein ABK040_009501 [Willaertia magna]
MEHLFSGMNITANVNNPSQPLHFETYDQFLNTRLVSCLKTISPQQKQDILKTLKQCNPYETHESIEEYYLNCPIDDEKTLREDNSVLLGFQGSPANDTMMTYSKDCFNSEKDYQSCKKAHEIYHNEGTGGLTEESRKEMVTQAEKLINQSPNCIEAYNVLALYKANSFEEALEYYRQAQSKASFLFTQSPDKKKGLWGYQEYRQYMRCLIGEANTLRKMGKYEEALNVYKRCLKLDPEIHSNWVSYINFQSHIPECLIRLGRWEEASTFLKKNKDILSLASSKVLLWTYSLIDFVLSKKKPNNYAGKEYYENNHHYCCHGGHHHRHHHHDEEENIFKGTILLAAQNCPVVFEFILGIRKLPKTNIPRNFSYSHPSASLSGQAQYSADHLDLFLSVPGFFEWVIKNCNTIFSHFLFQNKDGDLQRKYYDKQNPYNNFKVLYSKSLFINEIVSPGKNLLHNAVSTNNVECVKMLVDAGATIFSDIEPNAFHVACYYDHHPDIVKYFCEKTGKPTRCSKMLPQSPLEMAVNQGNYLPLREILCYLLKTDKLTEKDLIQCIEGLFGSSCYECIKFGDKNPSFKCTRCLHSDKSHSKNASFEKCVDLVFMFGFKPSSSLMKELSGEYTTKKKLVEYMQNIMSGKVDLRPGKYGITDTVVLEKLKTKNKYDKSSQTPSTPIDTSIVGAEACKKAGNDAFQKGDFQQAVDYYELALKQNDSDSIKHILYSNKSQAYYNMQDYERSITEAENCIKANEHFTKAYYRKAMALYALDRKKEAEKVLSDAVTKDPDNQEIVKLLNTIRQQLKK